MKASSLWKTLTKTQRRTWNAWAKSNPVLLDDGNVRRVSGRKAMTMIMRNRAWAGDAANPAVVPAPTAWLDGALSLRDGGPWTVNLGYVGFRVEQFLDDGTKWFVWATPPVDANEVKPYQRMRFVTCMTLGELLEDDLVPDIGPVYEPVCGSWDGPGLDGAWSEDRFIWFRVHHYANGQLSPGVVLKGWITVEL